MSVKELLGEELFEQVSEKLGEDTELIVNDGNYIPREKLNEKSEKVEALEKQLNERDQQIEQLKEDTNATDELKQKIEKLQEENENTKQELQQKLEKTRLESELDKKLLKEQARNPKAVKALLDMEQVKLTDDGVVGLDEQLKNIKESDDYLFGDNSSKAGDDFKGRGGGQGTLTMEQIDNMSEDEINENWDEVSKVLSNQK